MNLLKLLFLVTFFWVTIASTEIFPFYYSALWATSTLTFFIIKSRTIRFSLIILVLVLTLKMIKSFSLPPIFLRYYQTFNPNITSFASMIAKNQKISTYQIGLNHKLVFSESNWLSDEEGMIHMSALEPLILASRWLHFYNVEHITYLGPATSDLCKRVTNLKLNVTINYTELHKDSASCGTEILKNQQPLDDNIILFGPNENNYLNLIKEEFKKTKTNPWSIWNCSEVLAPRNPRKLPKLSSINSDTNEYYIEFPFSSCEVSTSSNFFKSNKALKEDPIINRLLMYSSEEL